MVMVQLQAISVQLHDEEEGGVAKAVSQTKIK